MLSGYDLQNEKNSCNAYAILQLNAR